MNKQNVVYILLCDGIYSLQDIMFSDTDTEGQLQANPDTNKTEGTWDRKAGAEPDRAGVPVLDDQRVLKIAGGYG